MNTLSRLCVKISGFKPRRYQEWLRAIWASGRAQGRLRTGLLVARAAWGGLRDKASGRRLFRARMRACAGCVLFDPARKVCWQEGLGCHCYLPFKAAFLQSSCWLAQIKAGDRWKQ